MQTISGGPTLDGRTFAVAASLTVKPGFPLPAGWPTEDDLDSAVAEWANGRAIATRSESYQRGPLPIYEPKTGAHVSDVWQRYCYVTVDDTTDDA